MSLCCFYFNIEFALLLTTIILVAESKYIMKNIIGKFNKKLDGAIKSFDVLYVNTTNLFIIQSIYFNSIL